MKRNSLKKIVSAFLLFGVLLGISSPASSAITEVTIAYQGPMTGEESEVGVSQYTGVKFAVNQFLKRFPNQFRISIKQIDDQGDATVAAKVSETAAADKSILGIVGPAYSGATIASLPAYKKANIPLISPSATRVSLTDPAQGALGFPIFHRMSPTDLVQGRELLRVATRGLSNPRIFVVDDQSPYGIGLVSYMEKAAGANRIVGRDSVPVSTTDWSPVIAKMKSADASVLIYAGYFPQAATLFKQLRDSGFTGILSGGDGVLSPGLLDLAPKSTLEGLRMTGGTISLLDYSPQTEQLFKREMGSASNIYATEAIDATNVLLTCVVNGVTTRSGMQACINDFKGKSITGDSLAFDAYGDRVAGKFHEYRVVSGRIVLQNQSQLTLQQVLENSNWYNAKKVSSPVSTTRPSKSSTQVELRVTNVPLTPKNFKSRFVGDSVLVTFESTLRSGAIANEAFLFSPSLGIPKSGALKGDVVGGKALIEIPIKSSMSGKSFLVTVFFTNQIGESNPLSTEISVPAALKPAKVTPRPTTSPSQNVQQTIICTRAEQIRTFVGTKCPPGWREN